ncbi:MAG: two-component system, OmpR family, response regulator [Chthoniobacter sp.]|jgi:DNA-binding response OmpR family regulator|nr:two-component system, OmpR family, response regulator [Chthoniobacter sp.]
MSKAKILVVDDDPKISGLIRVILEKAGGCEVLEENRSFAARVAARSFLPDVVLLDVDMPGLDGGDVATELRSDPVLKSIPILFVTSLVSRREIVSQNAIRSGHYVAKPIEPAVLLQAVRALLEPVAA